MGYRIYLKKNGKWTGNHIDGKIRFKKESTANYEMDRVKRMYPEREYKVVEWFSKAKYGNKYTSVPIMG